MIAPNITSKHSGPPKDLYRLALDAVAAAYHSLHTHRAQMGMHHLYFADTVSDCHLQADQGAEVVERSFGACCTDPAADIVDVEEAGIAIADAEAEKTADVRM